MSDSLAMFLATRDPETVEKERFGEIKIENNIFAGRKHTQMLDRHDDRVAEYWSQVTGSVKRLTELDIARIERRNAQQEK